MNSYKRYYIKYGIITFLILLLAVVSTHYIYYKFRDNQEVDYNSESLDITFHEKEGASITLDKVTPVTDSVGLTLKSYTFTVKNNLTEPVKYNIEVMDDLKKTKKDECGEYSINKDFIRISIKDENSDNMIYTLSEVKNNILLSEKIKALGEKKYTVRVWVDRNTTQPAGSLLHYHGLLKVMEE